MPELEKICEDLNENLKEDFRLWLTSMPNAKFPVSIIQKSVCMTMEPARDLKTNMKISYTGLVPNDEYLEDCRDPALFKKLTFSYVFFHAIIQCRVLFGPIGWNKPYKFTNEDLESCLIQLRGLINKYEETPWKVINYLGATINYGGRVT